MRIAIIGGTFDPIHNGHLRAAHAVSDAFEVDEVHFIPAFVPPHKSPSGITSVFHRFAMVVLATAPFDNFRVSTIETDTLEPRYSVDTLELMHGKYPDSSFLFVIGTDMFREIEEWKDYERLMELTSFAVVNRPGFPMREDLALVEVVDPSSRVQIGTKPEVYFLPFVEEPVSATEIRGQAQKGQDLTAWIPNEVAGYIVKHKLYE